MSDWTDQKISDEIEKHDEGCDCWYRSGDLDRWCDKAREINRHES